MPSLYATESSACYSIDVVCTIHRCRNADCGKRDGHGSRIRLYSIIGAIHAISYADSVHSSRNDSMGIEIIKNCVSKDGRSFSIPNPCWDKGNYGQRTQDGGADGHPEGFVRSELLIARLYHLLLVSDGDRSHSVSHSLYLLLLLPTLHQAVAMFEMQDCALLLEGVPKGGLVCF